MSNQLVLPVTPGTLPGGACPLTGDWQGILNLFCQYMSVNFPSTFNGVTLSTSPPANQSQAWGQLDSNGRLVRVYNFAQGAWVAQHPLPSGFVMIWPYALPDFTTFDGGDNNTLTAVSGPMWQQAQDSTGNNILQGQFPLGVGKTLPSNTSIVLSATGGEDTHILSTTEMPPHTHLIENVVAKKDSNFAGGGFQGANIANINTDSAGGDPTTGTIPTRAAPHNNMPPYYGVYFLQRTSRTFYAVT